jgi:hypothetical protein
MDLFKRNTPVYKSGKAAKVTPAQPAATSGLASLLGSLLGTATPSYKTADGQGAKASASSGLLSMFAVAPSYKTAAPVELAEPVLEDDIITEVSQADEHGLDDEGAACVRAPDEVVLL